MLHLVLNCFTRIFYHLFSLHLIRKVLPEPYRLFSIPFLLIFCSSLFSLLNQVKEKRKLLCLEILQGKYAPVMSLDLSHHRGIFALKNSKASKCIPKRKSKGLFSCRKKFLTLTIYFVKENHFLFSYRKLEIMFKISINKNNFLQLKQILI